MNQDFSSQEETVIVTQDTHQFQHLGILVTDTLIILKIQLFTVVVLTVVEDLDKYPAVDLTT
jgi:hypothetical protein